MRPAFDLENAYGVGTADHLVSGAVVGRNVMHAEWLAQFGTDKFNAAPDGREHAQRQHINFHEAHLFQIVFVPLDDRALWHRSVFHWHQAGQPRLRQYKAAHMLTEVTRAAHQALAQCQPQPGLVRGQIHVQGSGQRG